MKKYLSLLIIGLFFISFGACKKKEEQVSKTPLAEGPIVDTPGVSPHSGPGQKVQFDVVVPPDVETEWTAVTLIVEDKELKKTGEYTVQVGEELQIPDSSLAIKVSYFLPDFKMSGPVITSASTAPNNPAVGIVISEDGNQIFPETGKVGWLYEKFPTIHPFQHNRFGLTLKEGVKK
jgi:hypothetical protein